MMGRLLIGVLILLVSAALGQGRRGKAVNLNWKIGENEVLSYSTAMDQIDTSLIELHFGKAFDTGSEERSVFDRLNEVMTHLDYVTTLSRKGDVIDVVMSAKPKEPISNTAWDSIDANSKEMAQLMQSMITAVKLRGSVYKNGGIHSFWVKTNQKNLIALFFQLPTEPVKVGDTWGLEVNLISNDQNFRSDSSYHKNEVRLVEVKKVKGETIAVLRYDIVQYVDGVFDTPSFFGKGSEKESIMKFSHQALAEFSVDYGRWISYNGIMSMDATGAMNAHQKTRFSLVKE